MAGAAKWQELITILSVQFPHGNNFGETLSQNCPRVKVAFCNSFHLLKLFPILLKKQMMKKNKSVKLKHLFYCSGVIYRSLLNSRKHASI